MARNIANVEVKININRSVSAIRAIDCLSIACTARLPPETGNTDTEGQARMIVVSLLKKLSATSQKPFVDTTQKKNGSERQKHKLK